MWSSYLLSRSLVGRQRGQARVNPTTTKFEWHGLSSCMWMEGRCFAGGYVGGGIDVQEVSCTNYSGVSRQIHPSRQIESHSRTCINPQSPIDMLFRQMHFKSSEGEESLCESEQGRSVTRLHFY